MNLEQAIEYYFSKDKFPDIICKYQLFYQIGLGNITLESLQDLQESVEKLKELNLQVKSEAIIESVYDILMQFNSENNFEKDFDFYLKQKALKSALIDFINNDKGLIHSRPFYDMIIERINENKFFTYSMQVQLDMDYKAMIIPVKSTITDEISKDIKNIIYNMLEESSIDE
ncbi:hypothetical protein N9W00_01535 [Arcobacteraceae bacterium]|nr:hypothetical protein [Arcobacteraceae bacterium]